MLSNFCYKRIIEIPNSIDDIMSQLIEVIENADEDLDLIYKKYPLFFSIKLIIEQEENILDQSIIESSEQVLAWLIRKFENNYIEPHTIRVLLKIVFSFKNNYQLWQWLKDNAVIPSDKIYFFARECLINASLDLSYLPSHRYLDNTLMDEIISLSTLNQWDLLHNKLYNIFDFLCFTLDFDTRLSIHFLEVFDEKCLVKQLEKNSNILLNLSITLKLNKLFCLRLSADTKSDKIRFITFFSYLFTHNKFSVVTENEKILMTNTFVSLSLHTDEFKKWMRILNTYPCRYQYIQSSLGLAIAKINSVNALQFYFDAIHLYPSSINSSTTSAHTIESRNLIKECLENFAFNADKILTKSAWEIAYTKWYKWDFGIKDGENFIFNIVASEIDYPVIRYFLERFTEQEREELKDGIFNNMEEIENIWHSSQSALITYWNSCLSKLQIIYHCENTLKSPENQINLDIFFNIDIGEDREYIKALIGIR